MKELKTLKDIHQDMKMGSGKIFVYTKELKQEVVKWVKNWRQFKKKYAISAEDAFIDFFNLTEEELK